MNKQAIRCRYVVNSDTGTIHDTHEGKTAPACNLDRIHDTSIQTDDLDEAVRLIEQGGKKVNYCDHCMDSRG